MKVTKTSLILDALLAGDRLTHLKAIAYGTYRLADVVYRLRRKGYQIVATDKTDSSGTPFTEYHIPAEYREVYNRQAA